MCQTTTPITSNKRILCIMSTKASEFIPGHNQERPDQRSLLPKLILP